MSVAASAANPVTVLVELCETIARGDYREAGRLFELTGEGTAPDVARLAEAFGMMLVRVEAREMHLNQVVEDLRESCRQLEEAEAIRRVNERLRLEIEERERVERRLRESQRELEAARARAEDASRAKAAFLATMSHEIRTPMNGVTAMAEILDRTRLSAEQRDMTRTIRESASALLAVINDILDFSKVEAGKLDIERVAFDPLDLVEGAVDVLAPRAEAGGLSLLLEVARPPPARLFGDPGRIRQILLNVGGNALKFTRAGTVTVRVEATLDETGGCRFAVEVEDTGIGIAPERLGGLFQAFSQAEVSTARNYGGTGLGLAISRRLLDLMDGTIDVRSEPGRGSTFRFELPLAVAEPGLVRPRHDLRRAGVAVAGYPPVEAAGITGLLRLGGVAGVAVVADPADWPPSGPRPDLVILNGRGGPSAVARWADQLDRGTGTGATRVLVTAPHAVVPALIAHRPTGAGLALQGVTPAPVRARTLWGHVAAALGLEDAAPAPGAAAAGAYDAPPLAAARRAAAAVLVVDDDPTNRRVATLLLARMGMAHSVAADGAAALRLLEEGGYGLLLADIHMPGMDGFALARRIRAGEAAGSPQPRLAIAASTADVAPSIVQRCTAAGMDGCLAKPLEIDRLEALLRRYLPAAFDLRRPRSDAEAIVAAPAILDAVDPDVFDPRTLVDAFGGFTDAAAALAVKVITAAAPDIEAIREAFRAGGYDRVRRRAHAACGALLSVGAVRLARLMHDLHSAVEAGSVDAAAVYADCLDETYAELVAAVRPLAGADCDGGVTEQHGHA